MTDPLTTPTPQNSEADGASPFAGYSPPDEERPLAGYFALTTAFGVSFSVALWAAYRRRGGLPERPGPWDLITAGAATYKLTRLAAKAKVTGFVRAPFVRFEEEAGRGEVSETPRGSGLRYAIGELLVCPHCLGQWVAGTIVVGYVAAPRLTRLLTFLYSALALSDFAQIAYRAADDALDAQQPDPDADAA